MTLIKKNGEGYLPTFRTRISDLFDMDNWFNEPIFNSPNWIQWKSRIPATNVKEMDNSYMIELAAPGLKKDDFVVDIDDGVLEISVEKKEELDKEEDSYTRREYNYTSFRRSFTLPEMVMTDKIEAKYEDGVLRVVLPIMAEARKKEKKEITVS